MQTELPSSLSYVTFDGLDTPSSGMWRLTGAVTFYEADVNISHANFINNTAEDGLNIIHSNFFIDNTFFTNTFSDAFDADFCIGTIQNSTFEYTGNDAIDVSTSKITIDNITFKEIGDKGISVGENSTVTIKDISISEAQVGIASKDLSTIYGENIYIDNTIIAITLYQKKSEYGPAFIDLINLHLSGNISLDYLIEEGSSLTVDGIWIAPKEYAKENLIFEKMINGESIK